MKKFLILICCLVIILSGCSKKEYKLAVINDYPPYIYEDRKQFSGMYVEILDAIAKENNFKYKIVRLDEDTATEKLEKKEIDGIFTNQLENNNFLLLDNISDTKIQIAGLDNNNSMNDIKYKKIGILKNSYIKNYVLKIRSNYGYAISEFDTVKSLVDALNKKEIDKIIEEKRVVDYIAENFNINSGKPINNIDVISIFTNKKNEDFIQSYNSGLINIINNKKFHEIKNKYDKE